MNTLSRCWPLSSHSTAMRWAAFSEEMPMAVGKMRGRMCFSRIKQMPAMPTPRTSLGRNGGGRIRARTSGLTWKLTRMRRSINPRITGIFMWFSRGRRHTSSSQEPPKSRRDNALSLFDQPRFVALAQASARADEGNAHFVAVADGRYREVRWNGGYETEVLPLGALGGDLHVSASVVAEGLPVGHALVDSDVEGDCLAFVLGRVLHEVRDAGFRPVVRRDFG